MVGGYTVIEAIVARKITQDSRLLIENQFNGLPRELKVWNIAAVALNLYRIREELAQKFLELNLSEFDVTLFIEYTQKHLRIRDPLFGLRNGDDTRKFVFQRSNHWEAV